MTDGPVKKIVFLTGTRADFGKLKSLMQITQDSSQFEMHIFATGMHMNARYGRTVDEIIKCGFKNIFMYYNHDEYYSMDSILAKTVEGFSSYVKDINPDLIVLHGDRVETLAGAIVGALNNILTAHIEGGELSGTIDDSIRHSVSKLCQVHLVSNEKAKQRLLQLGEEEKSIFVIGSPDIDIMLSERLPSIEAAKERYDVIFDEYAILMFHPVTTEFDSIAQQAKNIVDAALESGLNYIVVYPNNDLGSDFIFQAFKRFENKSNIKLVTSFRFEYFITFLKHALFVLGNSSSGIMEAPYFQVPTVNVGTRQNNRVNNHEIINTNYDKNNILKGIFAAVNSSISGLRLFGNGNSDKLFYKILLEDNIWEINKQKLFQDLSYTSGNVDLTVRNGNSSLATVDDVQ